MRNAPELFLIAVVSIALGACQKDRSDQNIIVDNDVVANADIEALPPDESSGTPDDQLANGADNADVQDLNAANNSL